MRAFLKKSLILFLVCIMTFAPAMAKDNLKLYGNINHEFSFQSLPDTVKIRTSEEYVLPDGTVIPQNAVVESKILQVQRERRWHKSGYILCKLQSYQLDEAEPVDLSDKNLYFAVRKYQKIDSKEAAILTTEIVLTQAAGIVGSCFIFFAPVDIAYFFTKGAIKREKHHNWFKAGVHDAYDNSICWFWLKGKPIELEESESVKFQSVPEKKAIKLESQISKRNAKWAIKEEKKRVKAEKKEAKRQLKLGKLREKDPEKYETKIAKMQVKQQKRDEKTAREIATQQEIFARRAQKAQLKREKKEMKKQLKQEKAEAKAQRKLKEKQIKESETDTEQTIKAPVGVKI